MTTLNEQHPVEVPAFDVDEARYLGDEEDGVYYQAVEASPPRTGQWYAHAIVDCNTAAFVADYLEADGPYATAEEAWEAGKNAAIEWCLNNAVAIEPDEE